MSDLDQALVPGTPDGAGHVPELALLADLSYLVVDIAAAEEALADLFGARAGIIRAPLTDGDSFQALTAASSVYELAVRYAFRASTRTGRLAAHRGTIQKAG